MLRELGTGPLTFRDGLDSAREALGRALLGPRAGSHSPIVTGVATKFAFTAILLGAAAALRFALGAYGIGLSGAIFFPVILTCTLFAGWQYGLAACLASTAIVWLIRLAQFSGTDPGLAVFALSGMLQTAVAAFARTMLLDGEILRLRLLKLIDASHGFAFVTDAKGQPLQQHPRWAALTGMSWDEYREHGWLEAVHPEDRGQLPLQGHPNEGKPVRVELRIRDGVGGEWRWHRLRALPILQADGQIREWIGTLDDIHERKRESEKRETVVSELRHRLKNLMAIIEALAKYSAPRPGTDAGVDEFLKRFTGRLHALTAASEQLLVGEQGSMEANALVRATLAPFVSDMAPRFVIDGPELRVSEELGGGLALAVHELATNAIKYGALSVPQGSVSFIWTSEQTPEGQRVTFDWKERDGPPPQKPSREGFGTRMIKAVTAREKIGAVSLDYEPDGLRCRIEFTRAPAKGQELRAQTGNRA